MIIADRADEQGRHALSQARDRLIETLAAGACIESERAARFADFRKTIGQPSVILDIRADDQDVCVGCHLSWRGLGPVREFNGLELLACGGQRFLSEDLRAVEPACLNPDPLPPSGRGGSARFCLDSQRRSLRITISTRRSLLAIAPGAYDTLRATMRAPSTPRASR